MPPRDMSNVPLRCACGRKYNNYATWKVHWLSGRPPVQLPNKVGTDLAALQQARRDIYDLEHTPEEVSQ